MQATHHQIDIRHYAQCIEVSKRIRWEIERYVSRDFSKRFFPAACKCIALLCVAPFVALAYVIVFPVIGLGMLAWIGTKAWYLDV